MPGGVSTEQTYQLTEREEVTMVVAAYANVGMAFVSFFWLMGAFITHFRFWPAVLAMLVLSVAAYAITQIEVNVDPAKLNVNNTTIMHIAVAVLDVCYVATLTMTLWAIYGL